MAPDHSRRRRRGRAAGRRRFLAGLHWPGNGLPRPRGALLAFLVVPIVVLVAVAGGTVLLSERVARPNALAEVERSTERMARFLVEPLVEEALADTPGRWEELDRDVGNRLRDRSIDSVVVWTATGKV